MLLNANTSGDFLDGPSGEATLNLKDGWWRLKQLFPEFSGHEARTFPCGLFCPAEDKARSPYMMIEYVYGAGWDSDSYAKDILKIKNLKNAIGIPDDTPLEIFVGDF